MTYALVSVMVFATAACDRSSALATGSDHVVLLPERTHAVDLSLVSAEFRTDGGHAFIHLTGYPTPAVVTHLKAAGLAAPEGRSEPLVFEDLRLATVWGYIPPGRLDKITSVPFVIGVEPSGDPDGIFPMSTGK